MHIRSSLKNRNFQKLLTSQITSLLSVCIINYLLILRLYQETNSAFAITLLWLAYSIPVLVVGPFASTVVDVFNRKKLLIITNLLQAFTILLFIPFQNKFMLIYAVVLVYSFLNQFYLPAESAYIPTLFKDTELAEANGVFYLTKQISTFSGYAIAGFLNKFLPFQTNLLICAGIASIAFFSVLTLPNVVLKKKIDIEHQLTSFFNEVINGYRFIKDNMRILYPLIFIASCEVVSTIFALNVPAIAKQVLNTKIEDAAILLVTPALLGTVFGVYWIPKLLKKVRKNVIVSNSLLAVPISLTALMLTGLIRSNLRLILIPFIAVFFGISFIGVFVPVQTFLQESTPKDMLGRIFGNIWFIVTLATIVPLVLSASIIDIVGARGLVIIVAVFAIVCRILLKNFLVRLENGTEGRASS